MQEENHPKNIINILREDNASVKSKQNTDFKRKIEDKKKKEEALEN